MDSNIYIIRCSSISINNLLQKDYWSADVYLLTQIFSYSIPYTQIYSAGIKLYTRFLKWLH